MVWWCNEHKCHSIDDICYSCMKRPTVRDLAPDLLRMVKRLRNLLHGQSLVGNRHKRDNFTAMDRGV